MTSPDQNSQSKKALLKAPFFIKALVAIIAGMALSFIQSPYELWFLIFPCFGAFYFIYLHCSSKKQVFAAAFLFALGYFVFGLHWIGNALLVEGNEYRWVWPLAVIALPTLLASFTALYVTIAHILFNKNRMSGFLAFCALLALSEWVRGYAFTGFPWNLYGYGWSNVPQVLQSLSLVGPYGLTLMTVIWGCFVGFLFSQTAYKKTFFILWISSLAVCFLWGEYRLQNSDVKKHLNLRVHIIQPNIEQADKWKPEKLALNFEKHLVLSADLKFARRNIYVWPETALPPAFLQSTAAHERLKNFLTGDAILLSGALQVTHNLRDKSVKYHNGLFLFDGERFPQRLYTKSHLVPFGEYIPFQEYIPIEPVVAFKGFEKGRGAQTIALANYPSFRALICYEIVFPHQIVGKGQTRPDYILTVTNDGWYGDSAGPYQHFTQARFRAIEQGLPVIRSANTGISGVIDPYGRVIESAPLLEEAAMTVSLPRAIASANIYSRLGDGVFLFILLAVLSVAMALRRKVN